MSYSTPANRRLPNQQPNASDVIDWNDPLTDGLKFCYAPWSGAHLDLVSGVLADAVVNTIITTGPHIQAGTARSNAGIHAQNTQSSTNRITFSNLRHDITTGEFTFVVFWAYNGAAAPWHTVMQLPNNDQVGMYCPVGDASPWVGGDSANGNVYEFDTAAVIVDEARIYGMSFFGTGINPRAYSAGRGYALTASGPAAYTEGSQDGTGIVLFEGQGTENGMGSLYGANLYNRALDDGEHFVIAQDFFRFIKPNSILINVDVGVVSTGPIYGPLGGPLTGVL